MILTEQEQKGIKYENHNVCAKCGGRCCKRCGCACSPEDFDNDYRKIENALMTGKYSIDLVRDSQNPTNSFIFEGLRVTLNRDYLMKYSRVGLIVRTANKGFPVVDLIHHKGDAPCIFLTAQGCSLKYEERPRYARLLAPYAPGICMPMYDTMDIVKEWRPHQEFLYAMAVKYFDHRWPIYADIGFYL